MWAVTHPKWRPDSRLLLVAEPAQHRVAPGSGGLVFNSGWRIAVNDPYHSPTRIFSGDDHSQAVGRGAEDATDFGDQLDLIKDIDRIGIAKHNDENMACTDDTGRFDRGCLKTRIGSGVSNQARTGCLAERYAELDSRYCRNQHLVEIFDRLDEVRLTDDDVGILGLLDINQLKFHG